MVFKLILKVYIETSGCAVNKFYSEILAGDLREKGLELVDNPEEADIIILNACAIKKPTEDKMLARAKKLAGYNAKLIISGCLAEANWRRLKKLFPNASIIGIHHMMNLSSLINDILRGETILLVKEPDEYPELFLRPRILENRYIAVVPIARGCLGACTYCIDKIIWGSLKSYPIEKIVREVRRLVQNGVKEIRLSGQDTGPYGWDLGVTLADLLEEVSQIPGDFMIRIGMASPDTLMKVIDDVLDIVKEEKRIYRYFHIPVQSGSNRILKLMNRKYKAEEFEELVEIIRSRLGDETTIATDIISSFPTETDEDHQDTIELLKRVKPDIVNLSRYGDRPGVPAAKIYPKVHNKISKQRTRELAELIRKISLEKNLRYLNRKIDVLFLEKRRDGILGRTHNYRLVAISNTRDDILGKRLTVLVKDVTWKTMYGEIVGETS